VRELLQSLLLQPELARQVAMPRPPEASPEAVALTAVVDFCVGASGPLSTAGVMQHFAGSPHEQVLAQALATAEDQALTGDQAALHLQTGVARYWQQARRAGQPVAADASLTMDAEETERQRQLEIVRRAAQEAPSPRAERS
jgi:hypothetical protein